MNYSEHCVAQELMEQGIHPSIITKGFRKAMKEAIEILGKVSKDSNMDREILEKVAVTTMNSKRTAGNKDFFARIATDAILNAEIVERIITRLSIKNNLFNEINFPERDYDSDQIINTNC